MIILPRYFANRVKHDGKYNEIHLSTCSYLPQPTNQVDLGYHSTYSDAKEKAKRLGLNPDGCAHCLNHVHHG